MNRAEISKKLDKIFANLPEDFEELLDGFDEIEIHCKPVEGEDAVITMVRDDDKKVFCKCKDRAKKALCAGAIVVGVGLVLRGITK